MTMPTLAAIRASLDAADPVLVTRVQGQEVPLTSEERAALLDERAQILYEEQEIVRAAAARKTWPHSRHRRQSARRAASSRPVH